jgi:mycothiol synthase
MCAEDPTQRPIPLGGGLSARPAQETDAESIYGLVQDYDVSMVGYSDFSFDDLLAFFREEHFDITRDTCLVVDRESRAAGFAIVWAPEPQRRYTAFALVHPRHLGRGIGSRLLGFLERRMRENVADAEGAILHNWVDLQDEAACRMVEAAGFFEARRHYTMIADLEGLDLGFSLPQGIRIRACEDSDARTMHDLLEETFADHWGFTPLSYEQWRTLEYERSDTDLGMWFLALEGDEPVGLLIGRAMTDLGWVGVLGVKKAHRRRGIASALLRHSFSDFKTRGLAKVGLGVDASNEDRAVHLYESAGMRPERVYVTYEKLYKR